MIVVYDRNLMPDAPQPRPRGRLPAAQAAGRDLRPQQPRGRRRRAAEALGAPAVPAVGGMAEPLADGMAAVAADVTPVVTAQHQQDNTDIGPQQRRGRRRRAAEALVALAAPAAEEIAVPQEIPLRRPRGRPRGRRQVTDEPMAVGITEMADLAREQRPRTRRQIQRDSVRRAEGARMNDGAAPPIIPLPDPVLAEYLNIPVPEQPNAEVPIIGVTEEVDAEDALIHVPEPVEEEECHVIQEPTNAPALVEIDRNQVVI
ncbi:uncharacterized protein [Fopius arisanus]|uniref:Uncharacterized protein n=1 Tax=Fopius arisanus TaxID=64838 RepID=A0A9R1U9T7_9HYME|nr:PREDICTED: uncharacterized protein LOC105272348 [Fopius arisanus]